MPKVAWDQYLSSKTLLPAVPVSRMPVLGRLIRQFVVLRFQYTLDMKTATLPPVRVDDCLRAAAENVLADGESLSAFMETSVRRAIVYCQAQAEFVARGQASHQDYRRTGVSYSAAEVADRLQAKLGARRKQLGL